MMLSTTFKSKLIKFSIFFMLVVLIWISPLETPQLTLVVSSDVDSQSQLFTNRDNNYSEAYSEVKKIVPGTHALVFGLYNTISPVRWDPAQLSASLNIVDIYIAIAGFKLQRGQISIAPANQISTLTKSGDGYALSTTHNANDPQVLVSFKQNNIIVVKALLSVFFAGLILLFFNAHQTLTILSVTCWGFVSEKINSLQNASTYKKFTVKELCILFFIAIALNSYFITNFSLSIDDELGAIRNSPEVWIAQGRWAVYLIERYLLPIPAIPFLPYLMLDLCIALSYMLIIRMHGASPGWQTYLTFPVFCSFPTWWLISEFSSNVPSVAFGLLITVMASFVSTPLLGEEASRKVNFLILFLICILLAIAIASYQSLILLYLCLIFGHVLSGVVAGVETQAVLLIKKCVRTLILAVIGMITYFLINKIFQEVAGVQGAYLGNFVKVNELINDPLKSLKQIVVEAGGVYFGVAPRFGASIGLAPYILIVSTLSVLSCATTKKKLFTGAVWLLILATPFLLQVMAGANNVPMRAMISLAYVAWLMTFSLVYNAQALFSLMGIPLVTIYLFQLLSLNSQYIASASLTQKHDELLAADIYRRMGELDTAFDSSQPVKVDFFGHKTFETVYAKAWSSTMQASFFDWDNGNLVRIFAYMKIQGYQNLRPLEPNARKLLTSRFITMPVWPAAGSVTKVGDIYLIRLSKDPDPAHD